MTELFNSFPEWAREWAIKRWNEYHDKDNSHINEVRDWLWHLEDSQSLMKNKLYKITWIQAIEHQNKWHEMLKKQAEKRNSFEGNSQDVDFICHTNNDMTWFYIVSPDGLDYEGSAMGHCVGQGTYDSFENRIITLRDRHNMPHITMEYNEETKTVIQIKGRGNQEPALKYYPSIQDLFNAIKPQMGHNLPFYIFSVNDDYKIVLNMNDCASICGDNPAHIFYDIRSNDTALTNIPDKSVFHGNLFAGEHDIQTIMDKQLSARTLGVEVYYTVNSENDTSWVNKKYYTIDNYMSEDRIDVASMNEKSESIWLLYHHDRVVLRLKYNSEEKVLSRLLGNSSDIKYGNNIAWLMKHLGDVKSIMDFEYIMFIKEQNNDEYIFMPRDDVRKFIKDKSGVHIYGLMSNVDNGQKYDVVFPDNTHIHGQLNLVYYDLTLITHTLIIYGDTHLRKCTGKLLPDILHNNTYNIIIDRCHDIQEVNNLDCHNILIQNCNQIKTISGIRGDSISIRNCPELKECNFDVKYNLKIEDCPNIVLKEEIYADFVSLYHLSCHLPEIHAAKIHIDHCDFKNQKTLKLYSDDLKIIRIKEKDCFGKRVKDFLRKIFTIDKSS